MAVIVAECSASAVALITVAPPMLRSLPGAAAGVGAVGPDLGMSSAGIGRLLSTRLGECGPTLIETSAVTTRDPTTPSPGPEAMI